MTRALILCLFLAGCSGPSWYCLEKQDVAVVSVDTIFRGEEVLGVTYIRANSENNHGTDARP